MVPGLPKTDRAILTNPVSVRWTFPPPPQSRRFQSRCPRLRNGFPEKAVKARTKALNNRLRLDSHRHRDRVYERVAIGHRIQSPNLIVSKPCAKASDGHVIPGRNPEHPGRQNLIIKRARV